MRRSLAAALLASLLVALARGEDSPSSELPKGVTAESLGKFKITYYWVTCEDDAKGERETELQDPQGRSLGKFRADFVKHLKVEGTGRTIEGKTLNVAGKGTFTFVKHPWGTGAKAAPLEPFRSIAVDPKVIAIGTKIVIPQAAGALLPDGSTHDGVFVAADTGSGIKEKHIDVFCGLKRDMKIIQKRGVDEVVLYKLEKDERKPPKPVAFPREGAVRFARVNALKEADTDSEVAGKPLEEGQKVKVAGKEGAFWKLSDGRFVEGPALDLR
ncbi:MAG: 3D domain-containing protein [Planctomycetota bacterium]